MCKSIEKSAERDPWKDWKLPDPEPIDLEQYAPLTAQDLEKLQSELGTIEADPIDWEQYKTPSMWDMLQELQSEWEPIEWPDITPEGAEWPRPMREPPEWGDLS